MFTTPAGSPISWQISANAKRGQRRELGWLQHNSVSRSQSRRDLPRQHQQREVPRNDLTDTPASRVAWKLRVKQLRPTSMMIKMTRYQRNINVTALADGLAVVHRLQDCEAAGMLLNGSGQRVEISSSRVRGEGLPLRQTGTRGANRSIDIRRRSLRYIGELLAGGRVRGVSK